MSVRPLWWHCPVTTGHGSNWRQSSTHIRLTAQHGGSRRTALRLRLPSAGTNGLQAVAQICCCCLRRIICGRCWCQRPSRRNAGTNGYLLHTLICAFAVVRGSSGFCSAFQRAARQNCPLALKRPLLPCPRSARLRAVCQDGACASRRAAFPSQPNGLAAAAPSRLRSPSNRSHPTTWALHGCHRTRRGLICAAAVAWCL